MNNFLFIFLYIFKSSISFLPEWNIEKTSINLDGWRIIYDKTINGSHFRLSKKIDSNKNPIEIINYFEFDEAIASFETKYENIDSFYKINGVNYICPRGKFYIFRHNKGKISYLKPETFIETGIWDLKCYYNNFGQMYFAFLNNSNSNSFYYFNPLEEDYVIEQYKFENSDNFLDFKWTQMQREDDFYYNYMLSLFSNASYITLKIYKFINSKITDFYDVKIIQKTMENSYSVAYFSNSDNNTCYWANYNDTDLISGYTTFTFDEVTGIIYINNTVINNKSPLRFLDKRKIETINKFRNADYIYYKLIDNYSQHTFGIIDITKNKVIFHSNKELTTLSDYSMMYINNNKAYEACIVKEGYACTKKCPEGQKLVLDSSEGNYCSTSEICSNYKLLPEEICVDSCSENINIINDKKCYLCKDLYENLEYTLIKNKTCIDKKPSNSYYINENLKIIDYCMDNCDECSNGEKCEKCREKYIKVIDNIEDREFCTKGKCPEKYYQNGSICLNCHYNCKTCSKPYNETNENCDSCDENSFYKYLIKAKNYSSNCVNECPIGTTLVDKQYCISQEEKQEEEHSDENIDDGDKKEKTDDSDSNVLVYILIPIIILLCVVIAFISFKYYKKIKSKQKDELLLGNINNAVPLYEKMPEKKDDQFNNNFEKNEKRYTKSKD